MGYQAWMDMRRNKLTETSDWVVKVDADAVFLPERLTNMLQGYKVPEGGLYMENCEKVMFGFFGHLEVVSHDGFDTFLNNLETCKAARLEGLEPSVAVWPLGRGSLHAEVHGQAWGGQGLQLLDEQKRPLSVRSAQGTAESERTCGLDARLPFSRKAGHAATISDARRVFRVPCQHSEGMGVGKQALDTLSEIVEYMDAQRWLHAIRPFCV